MEQTVEDQDLEEPNVLTSGSLQSRMQAKRNEAEGRHSELFAVPNWEDMIEVELRMLGWERLRKIAHRHRKVRNEALQELYVCADQIIWATEGFVEVDGDKRTPVQQDWVSLARAGEGARGVMPLGPESTVRQALIALVAHDTRIMALWQEWQDWMKSSRPEMDEELVSDFRTTG